MAAESIDTVVVGGGQAGLAMSEHLSARNISHVVLERHRIAERWRSERWDSLVANGPAWHDRFPTMEFTEVGPDAFPSKDNIANYFSAYAEKIAAPIRCNVDVERVTKASGRTGFVIQTSDGTINAERVVAATGPFQTPVIPPLVHSSYPVHQLHSNTYRNPQQLPDGAVLVVGAGSSGSQIAEELMRAGRQVYLSVGPHDRPPRRYRGQDFVWWLGVLGKWDATARTPGTEHITIAVSGANGGRTVEFRRLAEEGMTLVGMTRSFDDGVFRFAPDLAQNIAAGDANYLSVLDEADAYAERNGLALPADTDSRVIAPDPPCVAEPLLELNLAEAGVKTVLWATGYKTDYSWLEVNAFDERGTPQHQRGISSEPGIYFLGLPWLANRASSFIWGVWHDARFLADHIATRRTYLAYQPEQWQR